MSHTDSTILQAALQPSAAEGTGRAELLSLLREAHMVIGPEYVDLLGRIHDVLHPRTPPVPVCECGHPIGEHSAHSNRCIMRDCACRAWHVQPTDQPPCIFCGLTGHWSMSCRAFSPTGKQL